MRFPDKVYDTLKWLCLIAIPALVVLLATVLPAFGIDPETVKVITITISAIGVFIGTLIGVSTAAYKAEQAEFKVGGSE